MGFMTVVTVLNDALHNIKDDSKFGEHLYAAAIRFGSNRSLHKRGIPAYSYVDGEVHGVFCNAAEVISQAHADYAQYVVAKGNTGWAITSDPDDGVPDNLIKHLEWILKERRKRNKAQAQRNVAAPTPARTQRQLES